MRNLIILLLILVSTTANAQTYYLIDINNQVRHKQTRPTKQENLDKDGLIQVESDLDLGFDEAEYRGGKIVKHVKTADEIAKELADKNKIDKRVSDKAKAKTKLINLGFTSDESDVILK